MKPSRLLLSLDSSIGRAKNQFEADCYRGEKAVYMARLRADDEATKIIAELHRRYDSRPNLIISIWLNLAEGLRIYFSDMGSTAFDKVCRAYALSAASQTARLHALSAAWLAQLDYMRHDVEATARHVGESLRTADPDHHAAISRSSLVVTQALHQAGEQELALKWQEKARRHANAEGDDATLSALIRNMAWLRMAASRQGVLTGEADAAQGHHLLMSAESTRRFDKLVGASTLPELNPLLKAQIFSLRGQHAEAVHLYQKYLISAAGPESVSRLQCTLLADLAWCHVHLDSLDEASKYAAIAEESLTLDTHIDDQAATHGLLAKVFARLSNEAACTRHERLAADAWQRNAALQMRVVELLGPASPVNNFL